MTKPTTFNPADSLALWKARLRYRKARLADARHKGDRSRIARWTRLVTEAQKKVNLRSRQVAAQHATAVSRAGVDLIGRFEGCILHPYRDAVGVWTIGYGHTEGVGPNTPRLKSVQAARELLQRDLDRKYAPYVAALRLPLNQNQFDALVSFVYNVGPGGIAATTHVGSALRMHDWRSAADHLLDWDKAGGRRLAGLTTRRRAERALFLKPTKGG